jgi:hypothetical protein
MPLDRENMPGNWFDDGWLWFKNIIVKKFRYPKIKKVSTVPIWMIKTIAMLTGNKELKNAASLFAYFEKVNEMGNTDETNTLLGKPETTFEQWIHLKAHYSLFDALCRTNHGWSYAMEGFMFIWACDQPGSVAPSSPAIRISFQCLVLIM